MHAVIVAFNKYIDILPHIVISTLIEMVNIYLLLHCIVVVCAHVMHATWLRMDSLTLPNHLYFGEMTVSLLLLKRQNTEINKHVFQVFPKLHPGPSGNAIASQPLPRSPTTHDFWIKYCLGIPEFVVRPLTLGM